MTEPTTWKEILDQALRDLGGDTVMVPGAKLHARVAQLGLANGLVLSEYLKLSGIKFRQFVVENSEFTIAERPGTDMMVGTATASTLQYASADERQASPGEFRQDVYEAFTRVDESPFYYVPSLDRFTQHPPETQQSYLLPSSTLERLLEDRKKFADTVVETDASSRLTKSLEFSANPLAGFHKAIWELDLWTRWRTFSAEAIRKRIDSWTREAGIETSPVWFTHAAPDPQTLRPQELLATFSNYLSDEEVRELHVPFRAVEAMLRDATSRRRTR